MRTRLARSIVLLLACAEPAHAYRPFEATNADVAPPGELEIEFGPVAYVDQPHGSITKAPVVTINAGLPERWEFVVDVERAVTRAPGTRDDRALDAAVLLKRVLHEGSLQNRRGWSFATEFGTLIPSDDDADHFGMTAALIGSLRLERLTFHCNASAERDRTRHGAWSGGLIVEGSPHRGVRPVAEATFEHGTGEDADAFSSLLGAIWERADNLSFDVALRATREAGGWSYESRIGLTWSLAFARK